MVYDLAKLPIFTLLRRISDAASALSRLDERIARTPTHELTIARDVLRTRRRLVTQQPGWALSTEGLRSLRQARAGVVCSTFG